MALIGVSGQAGAFTEELVREMARHVEQPIIFPLSKPTSRSEATLEQLVTWTQGKALVGTGSPFKPVVWNGPEIGNNQTSNSSISPGMGLGILAVGARRVTDKMFKVAGKAVAALSPTLKDREGKLLPPVAVAIEVARQAQLGGVAIETGEAKIKTCIADYMWDPHSALYQGMI
jgi:malate dehydrogenase (oxaloacetate-decarboxylating)